MSRSGGWRDLVDRILERLLPGRPSRSDPAAADSSSGVDEPSASTPPRPSTEERRDDVRLGERGPAVEAPRFEPFLDVSTLSAFGSSRSRHELKDLLTDPDADVAAAAARALEERDRRVAADVERTFETDFLEPETDVLEPDAPVAPAGEAVERPAAQAEAEGVADASEPVAWFGSDDTVGDDVHVAVDAASGEASSGEDEPLWDDDLDAFADAPVEEAPRGPEPAPTSVGDGRADEGLGQDDYLWNVAQEVALEGGWEARRAGRLIEILEESAAGGRRRALVTQIAKGADPDVLLLASRVRSAWNERCGNDSVVGLGWDTAVRVADAFAGRPDAEEVLGLLDRCFERFASRRTTRGNLRGSFARHLDDLFEEAAPPTASLADEVSMRLAGARGRP